MNTVEGVCGRRQQVRVPCPLSINESTNCWCRNPTSSKNTNEKGEQTSPQSRLGIDSIATKSQRRVLDAVAGGGGGVAGMCVLGQGVQSEIQHEARSAFSLCPFSLHIPANKERSSTVEIAGYGESDDDVCKRKETSTTSLNPQKDRDEFMCVFAPIPPSSPLQPHLAWVVRGEERADGFTKMQFVWCSGLCEKGETKKWRMTNVRI